MTAEEKLKQIEIEIKKLQEDLDDSILLEQFYSGTDPTENDKLKGKIKAKKRISLIIQIIDM